MGGVGLIKTIGTFKASTKSGYIEQLVQLQAHSPTQDTALYIENSALSFHLQFLLQPFLPPFPQISFEAGVEGGGGNLEGGGR